MSKNIILLSDGTGNSNIKNRGTNVFKLYEAIDFNGLHGPKEQVAFYDDGVGTEDLKPLKLLGGAFGWGLARNVRTLYKRLVQVYVLGDKIYLFGFSRGAFTVRTLAGLIGSEGVLDIARYPDDEKLELAVLQLYENYRAKRKALLEGIFYEPFMRLFFNAYGDGKPAVHGEESKKIEFLGVWDTVDAVGLPFDEATAAWNALIFRFKFPDRTLNDHVKQACHALSIDDQRESFHPLLWNNSRLDPADKNKSVPDTRIEQVWFPGVHSNIGGGYPQQGLSLVALDWMVNRAEVAGLQFIPVEKDYVHDQEYACDKLYDSRAGLATYYQYQPRDIASLCAENGIPVPKIHVSAFQRVGEGILGYAPGNLPDNFEVVDDDGVHANSAEIRKLVSPAPAVELSSPLLKKVKAQIHLRRVLYHAFLVFSAFTLYWLTRDEMAGKGLLESIGIVVQTLVAPDKLVVKLASLLWSNIWLTVIGLGIVGAALKVRSSMANSFSEFWSGLRTAIKPLV
jgi:uncharacterized protein (DUF2235 family)